MSGSEHLANQHEARLAGALYKKRSKEQKIKEMRLNFMFFDIDNSGSLSAKEFLQVLTRHHGPAEGLSLSDAQELLDLFDTNGDGVLDVEEFIKAMISMDPDIAGEDDEDQSSSLFAAADNLNTENKEAQADRASREYS